MKKENLEKLYELADTSVDTLDGVFGLIIGMFSGFIGATLGCRTQYQLSENMILKHLVLVFVILMGVNGSSSKAQHPYQLVLKSVVIWMVLVMFNRMRLFSTGIVVVLFVILYMVKALREHNKQQCVDCDKKVAEGEPVSTKNLIEKAKMEDWDSTLHNAERGLLLGILGNVVLGTTVYLGDKKEEYGRDFDWSKFVFGVQKCKSFDEVPTQEKSTVYRTGLDRYGGPSQEQRGLLPGMM